MRIKRCIILFLSISCCGFLFFSSAQAVSNIDIGRRAAESVNAFAFDLYNELAENESGNIFFSPQNISSAFGLLHAGAVGDTENEIRNVMHYSDSVYEEMHALQEILNTPSPDVAVIEAANAIWPAKNLILCEPYMETVGKYYDVDITQLDYMISPQEAKDKINRWVNEKTRGKIPQIVGNLSKLTQVVLTSAIYFNSEWQEAFPKVLTRKEAFYYSSSPPKMLETMTNRASFSYAENEIFQALRMQYKQQAYSMLVLLPKDRESTILFDSPLSSVILNDLQNSLTLREVVVYFPKFKLETEYAMVDILKKMGLKRAFSDNAQFAKLAGTDIKVDQVIHKTFIELDEEKTEAAAATAITMMPTSSNSRVPATFLADHPFIYFIVENKTNAILFMGRFTG